MVIASSLEQTFEITQILYEEARLLDEGEFERWLEWLSPEIRYWMPLRFVRKATERDREFSSMDDGVAYLDEDLDTLRMRVEKMRHRMSWSDNPASRTLHSITNIQVVDYDEQRCRVLSLATVYRDRFAHHEDRWAVRRDDVLKKLNGTWKLSERQVYYPSAVLESANLSIFF